MSTPKPGQIRCPTCLRSTPPAAFCTQCGSPIPASARVRPRGMDRDELEERVRRRPGEGSIFRRGQQVDDSPASAGYVPFEPEPEDALAVRPEGGDPSVYSGPPRDAVDDTQRIERPAAPTPPPSQPAPRAPDQAYRPPSVPSPSPPPQEPPAAPPSPSQPAMREPAAYATPPPAPPPAAAAPASSEQPVSQGPAPEQPTPPPYPPEAYEDIDDRPYGDPEDAYAYPYAAPDERGGGGGGGGALPIIGFVVLCVLALAVGAVLAGVFTGNETGQASPSPTATVALPTVEPTVAPTPVPTATGAPATPEPTDGPVTFADGAELSIQPCATRGFRDAAVGKPELDACEVDGSSVSNGDVTTLIVFRSTGGDDALRIQLIQNGEVIDVQNLQVGSILSNCGTTCGGLVYGPHYVDLPAGEYQLVLRRNGDFADTATFTVSG